MGEGVRCHARLRLYRSPWVDYQPRPPSPLTHCNCVCNVLGNEEVTGGLYTPAQYCGVSRATIRVGFVPVSPDAPVQSAFLISSVVILMTGLVFMSRGFSSGSVGYNAMTAVVAVLVVVSVVAFVAFVGFEVYRSIVYVSPYYHACHTIDPCLLAPHLAPCRACKSTA